MITNADMNTATQETYKAINSQITQNNGTWSLTQTSQGLSFSGKILTIMLISPKIIK